MAHCVTGYFPVFWRIIVPSSSPVNCLNLEEGTTMLPNVTNHLPTNTASHPKKVKSSIKLLWEPQSCINTLEPSVNYSQCTLLISENQRPTSAIVKNVNYGTFWYRPQLVHSVMIHVQLCPLKCECKFLYPNVHIPPTQTFETDAYHICMTRDVCRLC
jgi:hypothetical protein